MTHTPYHVHDLSRKAIRRLGLSLLITLIFVGVEVGFGLSSNSLALLTDAAHNFTDVVALALTWWALQITFKPANSGKTYGYHRAGILVALINSTSLVLIAIGIFYEAYRRFLDPPKVQADTLIWVGLSAVAVNLVTALLVRRGAEHDLNLKSAFLHLLGDVISTIGAVLAGVLIRISGANWIDPLVSVMIGLLILWNAWGILRESVQILMESTPTDIDMQNMLKDIRSIPGVHDVHDLHVWSLNQSLRSLSAHIVTEDVSLSQGTKLQDQIARMLAEKYRVGHATLQLECPGCAAAQTYCSYC